MKIDISLTTDEKYNFIDTNHLLKRLSNITGDVWVSERFSCKNHRYLGKELMISLDRTNKEGIDYCLTIQDMYSEQDLRQMYKNKNENKLFEILTIVGNLNSYYLQNEKLLTKLEQYLKQIDDTYNDLIKEINEKTQSIHRLVDNYLTLFPYMRENESLFELFNCKILKDELIIYIDFNYNYLYFYCRLFGIISLAITILTFFGMILIINSILWIDYEEKEKKQEPIIEEELDEIKEVSGEEEEYEEDDTEEKNI
jgi:hypothetical protein